MNRYSHYLGMDVEEFVKLPDAKKRYQVAMMKMLWDIDQLAAKAMIQRLREEITKEKGHPKVAP